MRHREIWKDCELVVERLSLKSDGSCAESAQEVI